MRVAHRGILSALGGVLFCHGALAEWRCDCTQIVGSCSANVSAGDSFIEVTSNVDQCTRVDYFVDGIPFVALVVDGSERQDWIARSESPSIIVSSCQVCVDNSGQESDSENGDSLVSDGEPSRLISVAPVYPPAAAAAGTEGYVDVRFTLSPTGTAAAPEVVGSEPPGVFDAAALAAISRWRYTRPGPDAAPVVTERVEFRLADELLSLRPRGDDRPEQAAPGATARNRCVREESRYDFGTSIDVSLVNACAEPLHVYSCSAGTGAYRDRWICAHTEQTAGALGPSALAGAAGAGTSTASSTSRLEIRRAPDGEYWWLACAVDDANCRDEGREWVRAMDRQIASIDPQDRTRLRLGRSF